MGIIPGLLSQAAAVVAVAEIVHGDMFPRMRSVRGGDCRSADISLMPAGMSSRKRSTAQSEALQVLSVLLQMSLSMC